MEMKKETEPRKASKRHFGYPLLSRIERYCYWFVWLSINVYLFWHAHKLSMERKPQLYTGSFELGWFSHVKDVSDFEWNFWKQYAHYILVLFGVNCALSHVFRTFIPCYASSVIAIQSLCLIAIVLTPIGLLMAVTSAMIFFFITNFRSKIFLWIWWLFTLAMINNYQLRTEVFRLLTLKESHWDIVHFSLLLQYFRMLSYGCYFAEQHHKESIDFINYMNYVFYVPAFSNGPLISYDVFKECQIRPKTFDKLGIVKEFLSCIAYSILLELFCHVVYVFSITLNHDVLTDLSPMDVCAVCWMHLNFFCVKYYVFYRFSGVFAKIDGITPPGPPKCIVSLYTFVDMWRYFDKGLYRLLQQCVYIPLGGSRSGVVRQFIASFLCFALVGYWHGNDRIYYYWAFMNWVGIVIETLVGFARRTQTFQIFKCRKAWFRRFSALCGAFSVVGLVYANMTFLIGYIETNMMLGRLLLVWYAPLLILGACYTSVQSSIDVN